MAPAGAAWLWLYWLCAAFQRGFSSVYSNTGPGANFCVAGLGLSVQSKRISCVPLCDASRSPQAWGMGLG